MLFYFLLNNIWYHYIVQMTRAYD